MSEKVLTSMKDEKPDLQKQIGCISGFFQLFDRHRFLTGQSSSSHNHNIPTNKGGISNHIKEVNNTTQKATANNVKVARENQQFSTESSGTSMSSSSRSSSMSSLEFRTIQIEPPSIISQMKIPENSNSGAAMKQDHQPLDFYDIVKDSLHKDVHGLSAVKTVAKEEKKVRVLKYIDSPRPLMVAWDSPRLSYDGRDTHDAFKSATKSKELPRLSLDSKQGSIKSFNEGTKSRSLLKAPQKGHGSSSSMQLQELETFKRPSSVVARLMGLEAFPDCTETCDSPPPNANSKTISKGSYSRFSLEPVPWRQTEASQGSQLQDSKRRSESSLAKTSNLSLSVYGEIEKRIADLEFKNSGKDLRALKQILDAMQRYKESFDITGDQVSDNRSNSSLSESSMTKSPRIRQKDPRFTTTVEMSNSTPGSKSPIFIMKPVNSSRKTNSPASKEMLSRGKSSPTKTANGIMGDKLEKQATMENKMRTSKLMQSSKVRQVINGENASNTIDAKSPRLQKKFGLERHSPPTSPSSSDSGSDRRQHNRQPVELSSPSTTPRKKFSEIRNQRRDCKHDIDIEVIHNDHSDRINANTIQLKGMNQNNVAEKLSKESFMVEKIITAEQPSPVSVLDASFYKEEPPSPVKKKLDISKDLDDTLNTYDSCEENSEDLLLSSNPAKANFSTRISDTDLRTQNLVQILQQIDHDDKRFTNFRDDKDPDHKYISEILRASGLLNNPSSSQVFHSLSYPIDPKLFLELEQIKTNNMGFNIRHNAKKIYGLNSPEQMQRKLIFDVVNDILSQKIILESSTLLCQPYQLQGREPRGKLLLDELCKEIDKLQHKNRSVNLAIEDENLMQCPTIYTNSYSEIPNIVLDIERLVFKDLITEVVRSELGNHMGKHCRKLLFFK